MIYNTKSLYTLSEHLYSAVTRAIAGDPTTSMVMVALLVGAKHGQSISLKGILHRHISFHLAVKGPSDIDSKGCQLIFHILATIVLSVYHCANSGVVGNWCHERQGTANIRSCGDTGN